MGIYFGLQNFNVDKITESIPPLLEGMKTAFTTSIIGVSLSLVIGKISQVALSSAEKRLPSRPTGELAVLHDINESILSSNKENIKYQAEQIKAIQEVSNALIGKTDDCISNQLVKLRNQFKDLSNSHMQQLETLHAIQSALGEAEDTSLLTQIQNLRAEQNEQARDSKKNIDWIVESMNKNNELISEKFDEFSVLLAKNNTEVLVEVMKKATEEFNNQMAALIERLVQENFQELNYSVQRMNQWQQENKEMISELTGQFRSVSEEFAIASKAINEITENTNKLTNDNSSLVKLIEELQKVMIEDTKYQEIVGKLTSTIDTLKLNTDTFDETSTKLNEWIRTQMEFFDQMNSWQQENREIISELTGQFREVSEGFTVTSTSINEITQNTNKLTNDSSHLVKLIKELQKVMIDDTKYQEVVGNLTSAIDTLKTNTEAFDETTNKLNNWVRNQMSFSDSVAKLLTRLEEIDRIKDINEMFWNNTKKQLNEGVGLIEKASKQLSDDIEAINEEFYERLNDTLQNLDTLIQRIIEKYRR